MKIIQIKLCAFILSLQSAGYKSALTCIHVKEKMNLAMPISGVS
jgi:hypothetical protein